MLLSFPTIFYINYLRYDLLRNLEITEQTSLAGQKSHDSPVSIYPIVEW